MAHEIMDAGQVSRSAGWIRKLQTQESWEFSFSLSRKTWEPGELWRSSSLKASKLETQEEVMFQFESEGRKKANVPLLRLSGRKNSLLLEEEWVFLFYSRLQLTAWGPLTLWRAICFTQPTYIKFSFIQKHPHRKTQNNA